ncbi:hypothetical protein J2W91_004591 [Paenibacillus amylolyticus]|uniref:Uncharacterized protein n=1 Tax=Paenibacillus amylolyticus TaxID=1451 RepID=A0AAP5H6G7_PAEAM|nr:hypothetical protein [Paenibacillus amylolyticus]MDR6726085.1 hypothetical protein [Paenibacillus amylolyticus]
MLYEPKLEQWIGSAIGPVSTAVGAVVGEEINGAVFGRFVSNKVKQAPYKSAIERYETEAANRTKGTSQFT